MRGAEPRRTAHHAPSIVQRTVLRTFGRWRIVIRAAKDPAFPVPALPTGMRRESAVAGAGLELRAVRSVDRNRAENGNAVALTIRMEVERYAKRRIHRTA